MVRLHAECYGRGPTKARTVLHGNVVVCVMEDLFTPMERTLVDAGRCDQVRTTRLSFQEVMRERFVSSVEELTGRRVRAYMSQVHIDPEMAVEVFVLDEGSSR